MSLHGSACHCITLHACIMLLQVLNRSLCAYQFRATDSKCSCPNPCSSTVYPVTYTEVAWPDPSEQLGFYQQFIQPFPAVYGNR